MVNEWQPGQLLHVGFDGTEAPQDLLHWIRQGRVGGVVLFARNVRDPHQVRRLVRELYDAGGNGPRPVISIDQEGGQVQRLRAPWTEWPPMRRLGTVNDLETTRRVAGCIARELADIGICLDFAPVVDVDTNPRNPIIGDRSFSRDPARVAAHGVAFIEGLQAAGVAACAKHFPGHGDTEQDSHLELPRLEHDLHRLREVELVPFRAAVAAGVASIMTAHVVFAHVDHRRPATVSPEVMAILREEIGYDGLVFSDDLEMRAVADSISPPNLVDGCLRAGVDALLACRQRALQEEVLQRLERVPDHLVERGIERMVRFKQRFAVAPTPDEPAGPPYPEHQAIVDHLATV